MKTFETEKHNIPEGATHYYHSLGGIGFYRLIDKSWEFWHYFYDCWKPVCDNDCAFEAIQIPQTNIETPEEKEVEWVNGDFAIYEGSTVMVIAYHPKHPVIVVETSTEEYINVGICDLSKPETEAERVERERANAIYDMCASADNFTEESNFWAGKFYDLGYRKES